MGKKEEPLREPHVCRQTYIGGIKEKEKGASGKGISSGE
jgi:hypothetical protein